MEIYGNFIVIEMEINKWQIWKCSISLMCSVNSKDNFFHPFRIFPHNIVANYVAKQQQEQQH